MYAYILHMCTIRCNKSIKENLYMKNMRKIERTSFFSFKQVQNHDGMLEDWSLKETRLWVSTVTNTQHDQGWRTGQDWNIWLKSLGPLMCEISRQICTFKLKSIFCSLKAIMIIIWQYRGFSSSYCSCICFKWSLSILLRTMSTWKGCCMKMCNQPVLQRSVRHSDWAKSNEP